MSVYVGSLHADYKELDNIYFEILFLKWKNIFPSP